MPVFVEYYPKSDTEDCYKVYNERPAAPSAPSSILFEQQADGNFQLTYFPSTMIYMVQYDKKGQNCYKVGFEEPKSGAYHTFLNGKIIIKGK